ncbi:DUF1214 domain-containing protein [Methylocapsa sp. S129]|uniref:DUF1214 domain-containing protein n=1 Tax=Methylocapsa sp. S129 TaxID=1641869 RepID=UPI00131C9016|nr:DUF1214 domain-containing protein [Methylocapsa sp. S129]
MLIKALIACVVGLALGLWATALSLRSGRGFDATTIGAWTVSEKAGAPDADPYTRAGLERSGEIPLAAGEGLQFIARADDTGAALNSRCTYLVGRVTPPARYWTLSLVDRQGFPVENPAARYGFRSSEIVRDADGGFVIAVAASAHSGNWLPIGSEGRFALALRLYDSPVSATAGAIEKTAMPRISRESCR